MAFGAFPQWRAIDDLMALPCCYCCSFAGSTFKIILSHIKFIDSHEPNFMITCGDCDQSFHKFNSFKSHNQRIKHNTRNLAERPENEDIDTDN